MLGLTLQYDFVRTVKLKFPSFIVWQDTIKHAGIC